MNNAKEIHLDDSHHDAIMELVEELTEAIEERLEDKSHTERWENMGITLHALVIILQRILRVQSLQTIKNTRDILNYVCDHAALMRAEEFTGKEDE